MVSVENGRKFMTCLSCMAIENCKTYSFSTDDGSSCSITLCNTCQSEMCKVRDNLDKDLGSN